MLAPVHPTSELSASPRQPHLKAVVVLTDTITGSAGPPTGGTVTFDNGDQVLCKQAPLDTSGRATCRVEAAKLGLGRHELSAAYSGSDPYLAATSHLVLTVVRS